MAAVIQFNASTEDYIAHRASGYSVPAAAITNAQRLDYSGKGYAALEGVGEAPLEILPPTLGTNEVAEPSSDYYPGSPIAEGGDAEENGGNGAIVVRFPDIDVHYTIPYTGANYKELRI